MKKFLALVAACVAITCVAAVNTAQAKHDSSFPGNYAANVKKFYHFTCNEVECGNWNVK
jgi:hypothetical protein